MVKKKKYEPKKNKWQSRSQRRCLTYQKPNSEKRGSNFNTNMVSMCTTAHNALPPTYPKCRFSRRSVGCKRRARRLWKSFNEVLRKPPSSFLFFLIFFSSLLLFSQFSFAICLPRRSSNAGSCYDRLFSPLTTTVRGFTFIARRLQLFLPSSTPYALLAITTAGGNRQIVPGRVC